MKSSIFIILYIFTHTISSLNGEEKGNLILSEYSDLLSVNIERGDYIFVGIDQGVKNRLDVAKGVDPFFLCSIPINEGEYSSATMKISVTDVKNHTEGDYSFTISADVFVTNSPLDRDLIYRSKNREITIPNCEILNLKPLNQSQYQYHVIDGVNYIKIPYANINDDYRYITIALSKDKQQLSNQIKIPKVFIYFKWIFFPIS